MLPNWGLGASLGKLGNGWQEAAGSPAYPMCVGQHSVNYRYRQYPDNKILANFFLWIYTTWRDELRGPFAPFPNDLSAGGLM
jgi:hypothetical protein